MNRISSLPTLGWIAIVLAGFAAAPLWLSSGFALNLLVMVLLMTLMAQSWNILGGFGGQFSFGHAAFFGTGAYAMAILQVAFGMNAWLALVLATGVGALAGVGVGVLSFRYGLKGSYFSLATLAVAEVLRIVANAVGFTGAGAGMQLPLQPGALHLQFAGKAGYLWFILTFVAAGLLLSWWLRRSRFGACLMAVRDSEDAAKALGIDVLRVKLVAIAMSAALMAAAGVFYTQYLQYLDPHIAYGPAFSVAALVGAVIGGTATVFGPLLGALALQLLNELTRNALGDVPGVSLVIYGALLVLMVMFLPQGLAGAAGSVRKARA
ncbi:ABC-type transporter, permease component [Cupriavidus necator]|uniref:ABC-type transporter, permease component n=1 Tax=Cupriavidus necator (strain ATCC 17699 / DSM 428 / KCTC 22496 / NCIMB 10442 / H16 / Stanier 337) TaxID=381666 RepID=Q0KBE8_CUPNH|nr:branched-chain amino acid ABC transporter permease [Cupriavidus necator]EON20442.1 ABC-type transporter, permease component [Cupriavidus sp. GA3-3]KUE88705.1 ABC transporter permease [Cupriavidus necator]QQB76631.1 branched-chain amino acid ABC transporter permease [Cupriavidus necator]CAJ92673.1 ABC-type transporter, permease component [Cupriavidus necator H16]